MTTEKNYNHRVIEMQNGAEKIFVICEVFYTAEGEPQFHNDGAKIFWGEGQDPLEYIEIMKQALDAPVLKESDFKNAA